MSTHLAVGNWLECADAVARTLQSTAAARDRAGGSPVAELALLRDRGLLRLLAPPEEGGGGDWKQALAVVRRLAQSDASIAQLLGYHYHFGAMIGFFGTADQHAHHLRDIARTGAFWGGAINARDPDLILHTAGEHRLLRGRKTFCTGARIADRLIVSARRAETGEPILLVLPARREGIVAHDDWDAIGQRQTESGSVTFGDVAVGDDEILGSERMRSEPPSPYATLSTPLAQLVFVNLYVGIALGALEEARTYTREKTRPWPGSGVDSATRDPYIVERYGDLWAEHAAAAALADRAGDTLLAALERGPALTERERGEAAVAVATAKVVASRVGLRVTGSIFDLMGARATAARHGFDRYWRDMRTHTLHDPLAYKLREVGDFVLNDALPTFSNYS